MHTTLPSCLQVLGSVLARGSHEFSESKSSMSAWKSDQQAVHEPPVALLLSGVSKQLPPSHPALLLLLFARCMR